MGALFYKIVFTWSRYARWRPKSLEAGKFCDNCCFPGWILSAAVLAIRTAHNLAPLTWFKAGDQNEGLLKRNFWIVNKYI